MAVTFVGTPQTAANTGGTNTPSLTLPSVQSGDIAYYMVHAATSDATTITAPDGWDVSYGPLTNSAGVQRGWVLTRTLDSSDSASTVSAALSAGSVCSAALIVLRAGALDVSATAQHTSLTTTVATPSFTPVENDDFVVALVGVSFQNSQTPPTDTLTTPSGWTKESESATTAGTVRVGAVILSKQLTGQGGSSQGSDSGALTVNHRDNVWLFSFKTVAVSVTNTVPGPATSNLSFPAPSVGGQDFAHQVQIVGTPQIICDTGGTAIPKLTIPNGAQAGDIAYQMVHCLNSSTLTITPQSGWTIVSGPLTNPSSVQQGWLLSKTLTASDAGQSVSGTISASAVKSAGLVVVRGADLDVLVTAQHTSLVTTVATPSFTPVNANDLVVALVGVSYQASQTPPTGTLTTPSGWTKEAEASTASGAARAGGVILSKQLIGGDGTLQASDSGALSVNHRDNVWLLAFNFVGNAGTVSAVAPKSDVRNWAPTLSVESVLEGGGPLEANVLSLVPVVGTSETPATPARHRLRKIGGVWVEQITELI